MMKRKNSEQRKQRIRRGDIYYAELNPVIGSEQGGLRPVIVVSNNVGNTYSTTVIVAAVTGSTSKTMIPTHVLINVTGDGMERESIVLTEQLRTVDRYRLRDYIGRLDGKQMDAVDHALAVSIGLD